jgi:two-component system, NtrC family, sensor kinase
MTPPEPALTDSRATNLKPNEEPANPKPQTISSIPHQALSWGSQRIRRFSIGNKINCGYVLTLSVTILGTTAGLLLGNYYERKAQVEADLGHEAGVLVSEMQLALLQARSHQQRIIPLLNQPKELREEYSHFIRYVAESRVLLAGAKSAEHAATLPELNALLNANHEKVERYFQQAEALLEEIDPMNLQPEEILAASRRLQAFANSEVALQYDRVPDQLDGFAEIAFELEEEANQNVLQAQELSRQIVVASILISMAIAAVLAAYTSHLIARPIKTVTQVARRATKESNFDLQATVVTEDEVGTLATSLNQLIYRVKELLEEQKAEASRQLIQAEKMSSLGRMIAGVAHEINNPVNFIYGNLIYANDYTEELLSLLDTYAVAIPNPPATVQKHAEEIDLEFLKEDLPKLLQSMQVGADRVRQIVLSLKDFARLDEALAQPIDLHACIDSTLLILNNRIKKGITVTRNYATLPNVDGYMGALYQVFMNIISNALDALEEGMKSEGEEPQANANSAPAQPQITITTERLEQNRVAVRIADNGSGITKENQLKIFETFFTTKPRGVGTGLGLAISRQIVEEKHQGELLCESEIGKGTIFTIVLPIQQPIITSSCKKTGLVENIPQLA